MKVSVALAAYKGEKYIGEQLESVLSQLETEDEIIISDDCPNSEMSALVMAAAEKDPRIHYIEGPSKGVIKNFENAILHTSGDIIFLCDQDDVWLPGKVKAIKREIENGALLVLHNAKVTNSQLKVYDESFFESHGSRRGYCRNVLKNSYMGCCMAFDKSLKDFILPFPQEIPMHDQYIGLVAERLAAEKIVFLEEPFLLYRQHGANVTGGKTSIKSKLKWRIDILKTTGRSVCKGYRGK